VPSAEVYAIAQEYLDANRLDAAERMLGHLLAAMPDQPDALQALGLVAYRRNRPEEAVALMERGLAAGSVRPVHWRNISEVYRQLGRLDEALATARRAISLDPADPLGPFNLAMVLYDRMELRASLAAARHCVDLRPNLPQGRMKLAQVLLAMGAFTEGWEHYEWRYQIPGAAPLMPPTDRKQWDGRPLGRERLLLIGDQGYGDVLMFARYVPWALSRTPEVVLACSREIEPTLQRLFPGLPLYTQWDQIPAYACFCPLSGLPRLHGTTLATIPPPAPVHRPDPARVARWKARLDRALPPGLRRIGIAWAGRPTHNNDRNRSLPLAALAPLAAVAGVALVSLQKGPAAAAAKEWRGAAPLLDLDAEIADFEDTAAIIESLERVICVDTSVGHLAGVMGKPAWILLPFAPDWRWLTERDDSPWYPTLRLFRAPGPKRMDAAVAAAAAALAETGSGGTGAGR
jgi:tetratricopeptide (TPR) repeat protein